MGNKHRNKSLETARNILLILFALGMVVTFFNLDVLNNGESVFSRTAATDLRFSGELNQQDFTDRELSRIQSYLKGRKNIIGEVKIETSTQDSYTKVTPKSEILFEVHVAMKDGFIFTTALRRSTRAKLADTIVARLDKDIRAYQEIRKDDTKAKSMINTM